MTSVYNRREAVADDGFAGRFAAMKILGISGSPRKGNTEWMVERILEAARGAGAETELVLLRNMDVKLCRGCLTCEVGKDRKPGVCVIKDDMAPLLAKMLAADAFVFGTPVYFYMLSALLKNFMDRTVPIWPLLKGKRAAGVAVAEDGIGQAIVNLRTYTDLCKMPWVGEVTALAKGPNDVASNDVATAALVALGRRLAESSAQV
jgi:multimeric flavodoxin WrbA